jgi:hypothetical protein
LIYLIWSLKIICLPIIGSLLRYIVLGDVGWCTLCTLQLNDEFRQFPSIKSSVLRNFFNTVVTFWWRHPHLNARAYWNLSAKFFVNFQKLLQSFVQFDLTTRVWRTRTAWFRDTYILWKDVCSDLNIQHEKIISPLQRMNEGRHIVLIGLFFQFFLYSNNLVQAVTLLSFDIEFFHVGYLNLNKRLFIIYKCLWSKLYEFFILLLWDQTAQMTATISENWQKMWQKDFNMHVHSNEGDVIKM